MQVGIVGAEGIKFTLIGEQRAKDAINDILNDPSVTSVVSGHCHLGGIDIWAEEAGRSLGKVLLIYPPKTQSWEMGYKPRNLQIAQNSDVLYCITVNRLPNSYKGMKFPICYHCARAKQPTDHVKSGGCWTVLQGMKLGKPGHWITIGNDE